MKFIKIIILLAAITPFMFILSGCSGDAFLDSMKEEEDFIAPFDVVLSEEESKRTVYFSIPDTGRSEILQNGDDASFNDIPKAIDLDVQNNSYLSDDVVVDNVTGLTWTKCSATGINTMSTDDTCTTANVSMGWSDAVATCEALNTKHSSTVGYANKNKWRLPRLPELLTIVNYNYYPAFDPVIFPGNEGSVNKGYWTYSSRTFLSDYDDIINNGWVVYFGGGDPFNIGINLTQFKRKVSDSGVVTLQYVRCVYGGLNRL